MSLLDIKELTHSYGDNYLFRNIEFSLNKGEHVGVVGKNGAGKSTFMKACTGQLIPDEGEIQWHPKTSIGYLDQYAQLEYDICIKKFLQTAFKSLYEIEDKMNQCYEAAGQGNMEALKPAAAYQELLEAQDFYNIDTYIDQVAAGLGLHAIGLEQPIGEISGGQRAKVILAKLLLEKPDVLLLDEPTNFLDKEHIAWFAEYLSGLKTAFMVVSHDYDFLEKITTCICDIDHGHIRKYYGTYSEFIKKRDQFRQDYIRQYTAQQREIKKTEEFIRKNIAGRKTRMAQGRRKQLARLERMEAPSLSKERAVFQFQGPSIPKTEQLFVKDLSIGYRYPVLSGLSFSIRGGQKIVVTGFNGIGKSTLMKTLVGLLPPLGGRFAFAEQVVYGYFDQNLLWRDKGITPIQIISDNFPHMIGKEVRQHLFRCGISNEHALQSIGTLSGGEQAKVKMCLLTLKSCNFLILDEPTNHLDVQAKAALQEALREFEGSVLLVSHEETFYRSWADQVINIEGVL